MQCTYLTVPFPPFAPKLAHKPDISRKQREMLERESLILDTAQTILHRHGYNFLSMDRIAEEVDMPDGYVIEWGGQFENLERAQNRLLLVVPATLILIFLLLFFSMKNLRDVLLIYTGIPFALIGGVFALWLYDIPFSVSAAVGFVALSGIAVLNGQILVVAIRGFLREGQAMGSAVINAAHQRLKPVLATAVTDALGFLPMALSTGVGAEVQRPLATVVIGGVFTSTILTLLVLPVLYKWFAVDEVGETKKV